MRTILVLSAYLYPVIRVQEEIIDFNQTATYVNSIVKRWTR